MNQQMIVIKRDPDVIEIIEPLRFRPNGQVKVVRTDEIASIATGLCMLTDDPGERRGIIAMAQALGVEVVR